MTQHDQLRPLRTSAFVALRKLAPAPPECWIVAKRSRPTRPLAIDAITPPVSAT